ncbi:MAG: carbohydrate ABC transporter permease [Candidatus Scalindua sp.]
MSFTKFAFGGQEFVGLKNYINLIQDPGFWNSLSRTAIFTVSVTILHLVFGLGFALLLNEKWFSNTLRNIARGLIILPWVFSTAASALMWSLLYHPFGLFNYIATDILKNPVTITFLGNPDLALWSIIVIATWKFYPFYMISILGGLQGIPVELYEAAKVDGASIWQRFIHITLAQLRPVLVAVSTIDLITSVGHLDLIKMLTKGGPFRKTNIIAYYLYKSALVDGNLGYGAAISTMLLITLLILSFFYLRIMSKEETGETSF